MARATLRFYAWLFAFAGLAFVGREAMTLRVISWAGSWAGYPALAPAGPSLWLGLTGSLMGVIAWLAWRLSQDPAQPAAWEALLLSKAFSASLFLVFSLRARQPLLAWSALVDAAILAHLFRLRLSCEEDGGLPPRLTLPHGRSRETWFACFHDAATGRAAWIRYLVQAGQARCRATLFDPVSGAVTSAGWTGPAGVTEGPELVRTKGSGLSFDRLWGEGEGARWDLRWSRGGLARASVVPAWLRAAGLTHAGYENEAPAAWFDGEVAVGGRAWRFSDARGCLGQVWSRGYAKGWWWAHALFGPGAPGAALELLSAPGPFGLRFTSAVLWRDGRRLESSGPLELLRNASWRVDDRWIFRARFGALVAEGECALGAAAELRYDEPDGAGLVCRNSEVSKMRLRLRGRGFVQDLSTDSAAVEFVERAA